MDIWFKAKVDWGEALGLLSDTEAGRFAKALWKYAATGEAGTLTGREQMLFALVLADLRREAEHRERISAPDAAPPGPRPAGAAAGPARKAKQATACPPKPTKAAKARQNPEKRRTEPRRKSQRRGARRAAGPPPRR